MLKNVKRIVYLLLLCRTLMEYIGKIKQVKTELEEKILTDFFFYLLVFCRKQRFTPDKISTLMAIGKKLFRADIKHGTRSMKDSFQHFRTLLISHSVDRSPKFIKVFEYEDAEAILDYMYQTYYRHYRWYSYIFTPEVEMSIQQVNPFTVLTPQYFRPLTEAIPLETHDKPKPEEPNETDEQQQQQDGEENLNNESKENENSDNKSTDSKKKSSQASSQVTSKNVSRAQTPNPTKTKENKE